MGNIPRSAEERVTKRCRLDLEADGRGRPLGYDETLVLTGHVNR